MCRVFLTASFVRATLASVLTDVPVSGGTTSVGDDLDLLSIMIYVVLSAL